MSSSQRGSSDRSLNGCLTCRRRKCKCDELRPFCQRCIRSGIECGGYTPQLRFLLYNPSTNLFDWHAHGLASGSVGGRRVLFSDDDRIATSGAILRAICASDLETTISLSDTDLLPGVQEIQKGPFSAFKPSPVAHDEGFGGSIEGLFVPSTGTDGFLGEEIEELQVNPRHAAVFSLRVPPDNLPPLLDSPQNMCGHASSVGAVLASDEWRYSPFDITSFKSILNFGQSAMDFDSIFFLPAAELLLQHYKTISGKLFSPRCARNSPWEIMHLPSARKTLARIASREGSTHAQMALLNGLLAVSAFNIDKRKHAKSSSNMWWTIGITLKKKAESEMQTHLSRELASTKYEETLIAFLTMATISITSGWHQNVRCFLLDAQRFIDLYSGYPAPQSRESTILHQIFLFLRIIEESTFIYPPGEQCNPAPYLDGHELLHFPSLLTCSYVLGSPPPSLLRSIFESSLSPESAGGMSMFQEIYGIPESLLSLLSRSTSLGNEIMTQRGDTFMGTLSLELLTRSKQLEDEITDWPSINLLPNYATSVLASSDLVAHLMTAALHSGLLIYFYRRVSDLHPSILQSLVDTTISYLKLCKDEMTKVGSINCGIVWPGFIAAVEALGEERQRGIRDFLIESASVSGMRSFDLAAHIAEEVWKARQVSGPRYSWVDLVRERNMSLVLT